MRRSIRRACASLCPHRPQPRCRCVSSTRAGCYARTVIIELAQSPPCGFFLPLCHADLLRCRVVFQGARRLAFRRSINTGARERTHIGDGIAQESDSWLRMVPLRASHP